MNTCKALQPVSKPEYNGVGESDVERLSTSCGSVSSRWPPLCTYLAARPLPIQDNEWPEMWPVLCRYSPVDMPSARIMTIAQRPPTPTLPRRSSKLRPCSRARPCAPLASWFSAPGRACCFQRLIGCDGTRYIGETVSGHPQGEGRLYVPGPSGLVLSYHGQWVQVRSQFVPRKHCKSALGAIDAPPADPLSCLHTWQPACSVARIHRP